MAAVAICRLRDSSIWPSGFQGVHVAAHLEDVGGYGVAGGMVGAHGARGVGDAYAHDGAGVVGRHGLAFYHRSALQAEGLGGYRRAGADDAAQGLPLPTSLMSSMAPAASPNLSTPASMATATVAPISMVSRP
jgi:hypothetical protein